MHGEHGYRGSYGDLAYRADWGPLIRDCPEPIRLVVGEHDRNLQRGAVRRWAEALDHLTLKVLPDVIKTRLFGRPELCREQLEIASVPGLLNKPKPVLGSLFAQNVASTPSGQRTAKISQGMTN